MKNLKVKQVERNPNVSISYIGEWEGGRKKQNKPHINTTIAGMFSVLVTGLEGKKKHVCPTSIILIK